MTISINFQDLKEQYGIEDLDINWVHSEEQLDNITNTFDLYNETQVLVVGDGYKIIETTELEHNITNHIIIILVD